MTDVSTDVPPVVEIDWVDSTSDSDWRSLPDALRAAADDAALVYRSCGYLIADEPDYVLLVGSWRPRTDDEQAMVADTLQIPAVAILARRELGARRQPRPRPKTRRLTDDERRSRPSTRSSSSSPPTLPARRGRRPV